MNTVTENTHPRAAGEAAQKPHLFCAEVSRTIAHLRRLSDIVASEPEFANWYFCEGFVDAGLLQFHPRIKGADERLASAIAIARAFGPELHWQEHGDGCWRGEAAQPPCANVFDRFAVVIHGVRRRRPEASPIDLLNGRVAAVAAST